MGHSIGSAERRGPLGFTDPEYARTMSEMEEEDVTLTSLEGKVEPIRTGSQDLLKENESLWGFNSSLPGEPT